MWLVKCVKSIVSDHRARVNMLNSLKNCTTAPPSDSFITLPKRKLEIVLLSVSEILALFVNTLTVGDKYSPRNRKNLLQPIQHQLSKKQKDLFHVFAGYLKSTSHFEQLEKKNDLQRLCISEIRNCERFS